MGRGYISFELPESGREEGVLYSAFFDYILADGSKLHLMQQPAWCPVCQRFEMAEQVPTVQELEQKIAWFRSLTPRELGQWAFVSNGIPVEEQIAELRRYIAWRKERQCPPVASRAARSIRFPFPSTANSPIPTPPSALWRTARDLPQQHRAVGNSRPKANRSANASRPGTTISRRHVRF